MNAEPVRVSSAQLRGRDRVRQYEGALRAFQAVLALLHPRILHAIFVASRSHPSLWHRALRFCLIRLLSKECGDLVDIREDVYVLRLDCLTVGSRVSIHPMTYIDATGGVEIGNDVSIAHGVTIMSTEHIFDAPDVPTRDQGIREEPVRLGNDVWIGAGAKILGGVTVGDHAIVAAGAVVTRNVLAGAIVAGVPARVIGERTSAGTAR